jgi:hypothetical protein
MMHNKEGVTRCETGVTPRTHIVFHPLFNSNSEEVNNV